MPPLSDRARLALGALRTALDFRPDAGPVEIVHEASRLSGLSPQDVAYDLVMYQPLDRPDVPVSGPWAKPANARLLSHAFHPRGTMTAAQARRLVGAAVRDLPPARPAANGSTTYRCVDVLAALEAR